MLFADSVLFHPRLFLVRFEDALVLHGPILVRQVNHTPGVFLIPQDLPVGLAVDTLILVWAATDGNEWENRLCLIPSLVIIVVGTKARIPG
jgi:hypothetical protein